MVTASITVGWVIALVVLFLLRSHLPATDRWWIWVPVTGVGIGRLFYEHLRRRREASAANAAALRSRLRPARC